ncbi:PadR family transcriptional regulator [Staphylococcus coagulans]|uniref:PadR family transcriptional regulator n=1 Tax=Staphylococcus coagulans TaxID=74706 RepID=UPI001F4BD22F|nr:helix-turn-helix transcriptional regulator [Staphylococcus coagulans]UNB46271.1 PadR family transcriptional regulator [Staphylococcus coagulans]
MKRYPLVPLSETMHYILLAVRTPIHGYKIMQIVKEKSEGEVNIAAGTLYGALENLKKHQYIELISPPKERKKVYQITELGEHILAIENKRLLRMTEIYKKGGEKNEEV